MYLKEIIDLITWPVLPVVSYFIIARVIKKYEKKTEKSE